MKAPRTCVYVDPETGEKERKKHTFLKVSRQSITTIFSLEPGAVNVFWPDCDLQVCYNCGFVIGRALIE